MSKLGDIFRLAFKLENNLKRHRCTVATLKIIVKEIEQHCPCGARPESLNTHPHVIGCPVERALQSIKLCEETDIP